MKATARLLSTQSLARPRMSCGLIQQLLDHACGRSSTFEQAKPGHLRRIFQIALTTTITALYESHPTLEIRESGVTAICLFFDLRAFSTAAQHAHRNRHHIWGYLIVHAKMGNGTQEISSTLIFGIASTLIAFAALSIAYLQLRRMRRVHQIYELA